MQGLGCKGFELFWLVILMKLFKILQYIFFVIIVIIALGVIAPLLPIPGNYQILVVQSGSMSPAIKMGSMVIVKPAESYAVNDVITFGEMGKDKTPITHRIHDIRVQEGESIYITKGDANDSPDQREISGNKVIGKVLFDISYLGYAVDTAKKPWGFVALIIIPALLIISDEIRKIWKEITNLKKSKQKNETV